MADHLPRVLTVVRSNWLNRTLFPNSPMIAAASCLFIALITLANWSNQFGISGHLQATSDLVFHDHEYWRLWTSTLIHADLKHLLSNLFLFFILGWFLNGYFGLLLFPVSAFIVGGILNAFILPTYEPHMTLIGASGIVFYLGGVWLSLYFFIQRHQSFFSRFLRVGGVILALFMPSEAFDPSISYRTHFLGLAVGFAVGTVYFFVFKNRFRRAEVREYVVEEAEIENLQGAGSADLLETYKLN